MYYNTTHESGETLRRFEDTALKQDERILEVFNYARCGLTASLVQAYLPSVPRSSIARALNTLARDGKLIKTDEMRPGEYGRPQYVWRRPNRKQFEQTELRL